MVLLDSTAQDRVPTPAPSILTSQELTVVRAEISRSGGNWISILGLLLKLLLRVIKKV